MKEVQRTTKHTSVLLDEALDLLNLSSGKTVVDATFGGGGHTREILHEVGPTGVVIAIDTDSEALERVREDEELQQAVLQGNLILAHGNYSSITEILEEKGKGTVDAILADLGFSSDQIEGASRGFSFLREGPLDMRLDQKSGESVSELLSRISEDELRIILTQYGEEPESGRIARAIRTAHTKHPLQTTTELAQIIEEAYPKGKRAKLGIHPATKTFQALRIAVNRELEHLEKFLQSSEGCLAKNGRIAVITFHSGEDRIVKHFFQESAKGCVCPKNFPVCICKQKPRLKIVTKKPILPSLEELDRNPRARSAKLRGAEKI